MRYAGIALLLLTCLTAVSADTHTVTAGGSIQDALDAAITGDTVAVGPGTYTERITITKGVILRSDEPTDESCVAATIIDGSDGGPVITINASGLNPQVYGLTIRNGSASGPVTNGGGINCTAGVPLIVGNVITGNEASASGGGVRLEQGGSVYNNTITNNSAWSGGGLSTIDETIIQGNLITGNTAGWGGGIRTSGLGGLITVRHNVLGLNVASMQGGGAYLYDETTFYNNVVYGCLAPDGAAMYVSAVDLVFTNNTFHQNVAQAAGGAFRLYCGTGRDYVFTNCVFSSNSPTLFTYESPSTYTITLEYCDLYGNTLPGGNITSTGELAVNPLYAAAGAGDFHLRSSAGRWDPRLEAWVYDGSSSPCIDAGKPASDYSDELAPNGGRINLGAYGGTDEASKTPNRAPTEPTVTLTPLQPKTRHDLTAAASGSTDADGDTVTYAYEWSHSDDGSTWSAWSAGGATLPASATTKGEQWKVRACASDGSLTSLWVTGPTRTILNTPPSAPTVVSSFPTFPGDGDGLRPEASGSSDDDGDSLSYRAQWCKVVGGVCDWDGAVTTNNLDAGETAVGEVWRPRLRAYDGSQYSGWVEAADVTICPILQGRTPAAGAANVARRNDLLFTCQWLMDQASVEEHLVLSTGGSPVAGTFTWLVAGRRVRFTPEAPLQAGTVYQVQVTTGVERAGRPACDWTEQYTFTTGIEPAPLLCSPTGTGVAADSAIQVQFDSVMQKTSVVRNFGITPHVNGTFTWPNATTVRFTPRVPLAAGTAYDVTVRAAARNSAGDQLGRNLTWRFTTAGTAAAPSLTVSGGAGGGGGISLVVCSGTPAAIGGEVLTLSGYPVAALPWRECAAGLSTLSWSGRSSRGTLVPAGTYLCRLSACGKDGRRATALTKVVLQR